MNDSLLDTVRFDADGLIPAVVQDAESGDVLMLAFLNEKALRKTIETGRAHYWSRSRGELWRKGETSGNEQVVCGIRINCEQNSLLLEVRQTGAVCHDGYATCYYRTLNDDGSLSIVRERVFDPATVYGTQATSSLPRDLLVEATRLQFGAYVYLRDSDLERESGTSRRLRDKNASSRARIADELRELAGVLSGNHQHIDTESDVRLEASQVIYWLLIELIRGGLTWSDLRPDRALSVDENALPPQSIAALLRADADRWRIASPSPDVAAAHATFALVAQACRAAGVDPLEPVHADLNELRVRPYLQGYFASAGG